MYAVYWAFSQDGQLLYIGRTLDLIQRIETHRREREWARDARWEYNLCPTLRAAMTLEREAIRAGNPLFNVQGKRRLRHNLADSS